MTHLANQLREKIENLANELEKSRYELASLEAACHHAFGRIEYDPIIYPAYDDPGDPEGTMGVDRQLPCHVPEREVKQWKRICKVCGKVELTSRLAVRSEDVPVWD